MKPPVLSSSEPLLSTRRDLCDVYTHIESELERVEQNLQMFSNSPNRLVAEIGSYVFKKKGKRIRPALLILCSKLLGYTGDEHIQTASLVEFIHTASLIHDDIIDHADVRRGVDSVHARWGPNISVLLGDYLYIKTIGLSLQSRYPQIIRILADISARMIEGELTEYRRSYDLDLDEQAYLEIIHNKTASLFSAACQIGGVLGRATPEEEEAFVTYGSNLGMTFQIIDDLLDFQGDPRNLGKPVLSDLNEGRITLPLIYAMSNDGQPDCRRLRGLLKNRSLAEESKQEILAILRGTGALEYTFRRAEEFSRRSRDVIGQFPASPHREALQVLAEFVLKRDQ